MTAGEDGEPVTAGGSRTRRALGGGGTPGRCERRLVPVAAALLLVLSTGSARSVAPPPAGPTAPTGPVVGGTILPDGRLLTPAGRTLTIGDFPLGVAVSPHGRLVVSSNSGYGFGINIGFNSYCEQPGQRPASFGQSGAVCQDQPRGTVGDPATPTFDESLSVLDTVTGAVTTVLVHPTIRNPAAIDNYPPSNSNYFYVGVAFSPDGTHLYASGGGNDQVYDFPVSGEQTVGGPPRVLQFPSCLSTPSFNCGNQMLPQSPSGSVGLPVLGSIAGYTKGLTPTPDGRYLLVTQEQDNRLYIVDTSTFQLSAPNGAVALGNPAPMGGCYPYTAVVDPAGSTAYVPCQGLGIVLPVRLVAGSGIVGTPIPVGDHPTNLAISPDGSQLYVANADDDTLSVITTSPIPTVARTITLHAFQSGEQLGSIPDAVAVSPDGQRLYVALAGDNAVVVLGTAAALSATPGGGGPPGPGTGPGSSSPPPSLPPGTPAAVIPPPAMLPNTAGPASPDPAALLVGGLLPTGWYPTGVALSPDGSQLYVTSAKGLGSQNPDPALGGSPALTTTYQYDATNIPGTVQVIAAPGPADLASGTLAVQNDILQALRADPAAAGSPIPQAVGGTSPITHVIEVVRENRTFDQVLGDLGQDTGRGPAQVDGDPTNTSFGRDTTPNAHAVAGDPIPCANGRANGTRSVATDPCPAAEPAFAVADNFYSDGEASIQGHWWTAAASVNDYVEKSWRQYYSNRGHVYDPLGTVSEPHNCTIFQSLYARQVADPTFTFRDYGEAFGLANVSVAGTPVLPPPLTGSASDQHSACALSLPPADLDPNTFNAAVVANELTLDQDGRQVAGEFIRDAGLGGVQSPAAAAQCVPNAQTLPPLPAPAGSFLRNFSYIALAGDHTGGLQFQETPRSRVAENDAGLGCIIDAVSHSAYWSSTAIFVMEDDSQDGLDHRDGHRNLLYVISPYAKHGMDAQSNGCVPGGPGCGAGYVGHRHYSQASVLHTEELILGLQPLSSFDEYAAPLYDLFQPGKTAMTALSPADLASFSVEPEYLCIGEGTKPYGNTGGGAADPCPTDRTALGPHAVADLLDRSRQLDLHALDAASPDLEVIAWQLGHPGAPVPRQLLDERAAADLRRAVDG